VAALTAALPTLQGVLRTIAAMCVANVAREESSAALVRALREGLRAVNADPSEQAFYAACPFGEGFAGDIGHVVGRLGHERAKALLWTLSQSLAGEVELLPAMGLTNGMLRAGMAEPYAGAPLGDRARAALAALFGSDGVWRVVNNTYSFTAYGLPTTRQKLGELLALQEGDAARGRTALDAAIALCQDGRLEEALPLLHEATRLWPQEAIGWANLTWALNRLERKDEAAAVGERACALFEYVPLFREHTSALSNAKRHPQCIAAATRGLEEAPDDVYLLYSRACSFALLGQGNEALADLTRTIAADPNTRADIAADEDFASLRAQPKFQSLIQSAP
jgi:tetratricopeptide (TPR) repeat protein